MWVEFVVGSRPCFPREVFLQVLWFSPLLKNQYLQIPIRSSVSPISSALVHSCKIETIIKLFDLSVTADIQAEQFASFARGTIYNNTSSNIVRA